MWREPISSLIRLNCMRIPIAFALVVSMILTACSSTDPDPADVPAVMAAAVLELVSVDHTFGEGPPPFTTYLVETRLDPSAGDPITSDSTESRDLTDAERAEIAAVLETFGEVRWIDDPDEWITDDLSPVLEGSVIISVGQPSFDGDEAVTGVSLWCGGLCGAWITYRLADTASGWEVSGVESRAIS